MVSSCAGNDPKAIASEYCNCREVEANQGALQGNKCFEDWYKKYENVNMNEFSEEEQKEYLKTTQDCNP